MTDRVVGRLGRPAWMLVVPVLAILAASVVGPRLGAPEAWAGRWPGLAPNPWQARRPLVIAHQGGSQEGPSNTLYAFRNAMRRGADMMELDVHVTADGHLVVMHDDTVDRTTGASGFVRDLTLAEVQALDAAYCWHPGTGDRCDNGVTGGDYPFRGVATAAKPAPEGFTAADFRIPTLEQVLGAIRTAERELGRDVLLMMEIKYNPAATAHPPAAPFEDRVARRLATPAYGRGADDTIVVATQADVAERFRAAAALHDATFSMAAPAAVVAAFVASSAGPLPGLPHPSYQVLAVPRRVPETGQTVIDDGGDFVKDAHADGFAVHAWTINDRAEMAQLLALGVDGLITDRPSDALDMLMRAREDSNPQPAG